MMWIDWVVLIIVVAWLLFVIIVRPGRSCNGQCRSCFRNARCDKKKKL